MKHFSGVLIILLLSALSGKAYSQTGAIRINQVGYYPDANKVGFVVYTKATTFEVVNTADDVVELSGNLSAQVFWKDAGDSIKRFDFSALTKPGKYKIRIPGFGESSVFEISSVVLRKAAYASLKSYYYQRSSFELTAPYAGLWARPAGHPDTEVILHTSTGKTGTISSPGGWYDAGDYGKYVINAGISVASMLSFYENYNFLFEDGSIHIPESGNGQNDLLDEVKFELDWLKTMQDTDGGVFFKLTTLSFSGMVMPHEDVAARYAIGKTSASALDFAAMMAMAGRIYQNYDKEYADDCILRAENAWTWANTNPVTYFKNPSGVSTGEYGDGNVNDEFIWAAAELYITTQKDIYKTYLEGKSSSLTYNDAPGWPNVQSLASLSLATRPNGLSETLLNTIKNSIKSKADSWLGQINSNPARIPNFGYNWGSNSAIANQGVGLLYAYILSGDTKYIKGAAECADYLLGKNATGFSFVSAYGYKTPMFFHHRPSHDDGIRQPVPGFVSGGPNSGKQDNCKYPFPEAAKCFVDVMESYASNEVCINWNSPMTALFAGVDAVMGDTSQVEFEVQTSINNPPVLNVTAPLYDSRTGSDVVLKVKGTATDPDGIAKVELYINYRYYGTLETGTFEWDLSSLPYGSHIATILAYDATGLYTEKSHPFRNYLISSIPGKVEAELYYNMSGITTQVTTDEGLGLNVNGNGTGDWIDYSLNMLETGDYRVEYRIASPVAGGKLELRKPTALVLSAMTVPNTGGLQKWMTIADTISLTAGKLVLRLHTVSGGWNINWINFVLLDPVPVPEIVSVDEVNSISVSPNPVSRSFKVSYHLEKPESVDFTIYDETGRVVGIHKSEQNLTLSNDFIWTPDANLAPGYYYIGMSRKGSKIAQTKFMKIN